MGGLATMTITMMMMMLFKALGFSFTLAGSTVLLGNPPVDDGDDSEIPAELPSCFSFHPPFLYPFLPTQLLSPSASAHSSTRA